MGRIFAGYHKAKAARIAAIGAHDLIARVRQRDGAIATQHHAAHASQRIDGVVKIAHLPLRDTHRASQFLRAHRLIARLFHVIDNAFGKFGWHIASVLASAGCRREDVFIDRRPCWRASFKVKCGGACAALQP